MPVEVLSHEACRGTAKASRPLIISAGDVSKSDARFHGMRTILDNHSCICFILHGRSDMQGITCLADVSLATTDAAFAPWLRKGAAAPYRSTATAT